MKISPVHILLFFFASIPTLYSQNHTSIKSGENIFISSNFEEPQKFNSEKSTSVGCPASMSLAGKDTAWIVSIPSGSTLSCLSKPFIVYANAPSSISDSINQIWYPCILVRLIYSSGMNISTTLKQYEGGIYTSCLGSSSSCGFPVGYPSYISGSWFYYHAYLNPTKSHDFVFNNTSITPTSTVTLKSCWTNQVYTTGVWPGAISPNYTISVPANTNIGTASMSIVPTVTNTLAFQDLKNAQCYINPQLLALGTYTVTYTFKDTICAGTTAQYIFTVGLPNSTWTAPSVCIGSCPTLTPSASAVPGGIWSGTGVSGTTFCGSTVGSNNVTYSVGTGTCSSATTHTVMVYNYPSLTATPPAPFCRGGSASISASGATMYNWSPAIGLNTTTGSIVIASPTTSINYSLGGTANGCTSSIVVPVTIYPKPLANFTANPQTTTITAPTVNFTDLSSGATIANWLWNFGDGGNSNLKNPSYTYASIGTFSATLIVTSNLGCLDTSFFRIDIKADNITVYNSFSPNGDGLNDIFEIDNIDQFGGNHVYIYNRWGQLLWDGSNYDNVNVVWDGKDNKKNLLSPGTYFYIIEVNGKKTEKNWIELTK